MPPVPTLLRKVNGLTKVLQFLAFFYLKQRTGLLLRVEDEAGLLQATIFERVYERYGHILHRRSSLLLEGWVEYDKRRGFSFLVDRREDLAEVLSETKIPSPRTSSGSGAFIRVGRGSSRRRAG